METYFLKNEDLPRLYERLSQGYDLFAPVSVESPLKPKCGCEQSFPSEDYLLKRYSKESKEEFVFNSYRSIEPLRTFFTEYKEEVCGYFSDMKKKERPRAICGVKNCDLFSLKIQDYVFLEGAEADPVYKARRESTLIISGDCPGFKEVCFCKAFDINPYPAEGFDMNLSPLTNGYLLDIATDKAREIAASLKDILSPVTLGQTSGRAAKRELMSRKLLEHLSRYSIPRKEDLREIVSSGYNSSVWQEQMRTCVECGGCVFMCDTCHCFLLADELNGENSRRLRLWDGCMFNNFTRVAGGANPLKMRYMRLRNRYLKKFDFFIANLGFQACCGCGRCIDVCPGKIDIRYILRKLDEEKHIPAA
jgi:ferredoxin